MSEKKRKSVKMNLKAWVLIAVFVIVAAVALLLFLPGGDKKPLSSYPFVAHFVDVGQGDGIVIRCGETAIVVDGGETSEADEMDAVLREEGIESIDCYIASHPHADHIGAAESLIRRYDVKNVMMTHFSELNMPTSVLYENMLRAIEEKNCEVLFAGGGDSYDFGDLHLDVFSPLTESSDYNEMSLVIKLTYKGVSFLLTGDAGIAVENQIMGSGSDVHATVLKVGHHGSDTSTGEAFLKKVAPTIAVISCGYQNDYGHPNEETLKRLDNAGVSVYRTDTQGTVSLYSDGRRVISAQEPQAIN